MLEQALAILLEKRPEHWLRFDMQSLYGECLSKAGKAQQAEAELTQALDALITRRGADDPASTKARKRLAEHRLRHP